MSFYKLAPLDAKNKPYEFSQLKGKVVLIVNVASKCGFTPQYRGLQELNKKYANKDFQILGFPCNQFLWQEPGNAEQIAKFCSLNYGVTFPVLKKIDVNGRKTDPVYKFLKSQKKSCCCIISTIKWNFEKFLVDKNGRVRERYSSFSTPSCLTNDINKLLRE